MIFMYNPIANNIGEFFMDMLHVCGDGTPNPVRVIHLDFCNIDQKWKTDPKLPFVLEVKGPNNAVTNGLSCYYDTPTQTLNFCVGDSVDANKFVVLTGATHFQLLKGTIINVLESETERRFIMTPYSQVQISETKKLVLRSSGHPRILDIDS
jgi:hypothetical protein